MTHLKSNIKTKPSIKYCKNVNFPILHNFKEVSFGNFEIPILVNYCQVFLKPFLCKFKY